jgi:hypothetical protein
MAEQVEFVHGQHHLPHVERALDVPRDEVGDVRHQK